MSSGLHVHVWVCAVIYYVYRGNMASYITPKVIYNNIMKGNHASSGFSMLVVSHDLNNALFLQLTFSSIFQLLVVTGATDGIGKAYAEEVRLHCFFFPISLHRNHNESSVERS